MVSIMAIRFRRWVDGAEFEVNTLDDYKRLYDDGKHYIFFFFYATHTSNGMPLVARKRKKIAAPKKAVNENNAPKPTTNSMDDEAPGDKSS